MSIEITIDLKCDECGAILDGQERGGYVVVVPCEKCLSKEYDRGRKDGEQDAS